MRYDWQCNVLQYTITQVQYICIMYVYIIMNSECCILLYGIIMLCLSSPITELMLLGRLEKTNTSAITILLLKWCLHVHSGSSVWILKLAMKLVVYEFMKPEYFSRPQTHPCNENKVPFWQKWKIAKMALLNPCMKFKNFFGQKHSFEALWKWQ